MNHHAMLFLLPVALALICLLVRSVCLSSSPSRQQVVRFALSGGENLKNLPLACDQDARAILLWLSCKLASQGTRLGGQDESSATERSAVLGMIQIPPQKCGRFRLRYETRDPLIRQSVDEACDFLSSVIGKRRLPSSVIRIRVLPSGESRAYANGLEGEAAIYLEPGVLDVGTAIHELAHHIEGDHRFILELSKHFISRRAKDGTPERLRDMTGIDYGVNEVAYRGNWTTRGGDHYAGKFYGPSLLDAGATEVIPMGLERLYHDPAAFFREDSDYFLFLLLALQAG